MKQIEFSQVFHQEANFSLKLTFFFYPGSFLFNDWCQTWKNLIWKCCHRLFCRKKLLFLPWCPDWASMNCIHPLIWSVMWSASSGFCKCFHWCCVMLSSTFTCRSWIWVFFHRYISSFLVLLKILYYSTFLILFILQYIILHIIYCIYNVYNTLYVIYI